MARFLPEDFRPELLNISIEEVFPNCTEVFYCPSLEELSSAGINTQSAEPYRKRIAEFNAQDSYISLSPIITLPEHPEYLKPKYSKIETISIDASLFEAPETNEDVVACLEMHLPAGFVKDIRYGLGLTRDYRFIIGAIEKLTDSREIYINNKDTKEDADYDFFNLNIHDLNSMRRECDRITNRCRKVAQITKTRVMYNHFANWLERPQQPLPDSNDAISKMMNLKLSTTDKHAAMSLVAGDKTVVEQTDPVTLGQLRNDIELVSLERLIEDYKKLLEKNVREDTWQKLFNKNPFILSLTFGFPAIKISDQASVGGKKLTGDGEKITDYLIKNGVTNNLAIIEIKKPSTSLLNKTPYRDSVYSASTELTGSVTQVLDQCYRLEQNIASIKVNNRMYDIESYAIHCILIAGTLPEDEDQKKSFEIYRRNSRNVLIITFDELLLKLTQLHDFLSAPPGD
ncbi:Shedu immune nuclease family protein [Pantoea agglomerans]|uniref:Shedu immune nuclease family protein n=1 Tax=Enterobacter agglomerans TaxID=549 RepID=UPI003C7B7E77